MAKNNKYLIGIGTNKAGRTSLFNYLGDHPKITPSIYKQLNYFFDDSSTAIDPSSKWNKPYQKAFKTNEETEFLLDISPDYMYDPKVIDRIKQELKDDEVYILCILRDPVERFISWFNYSKQNGHLEEQVDFDEYLRRQDDNSPSINPFAALRTGHYISYLDSFIHNFPNLKIIFTEDLKSRPKEILTEISLWLNLDDSIYRDYTFSTYNKTVKVKNRVLENLYLSIHGWVKKGLINLPFFFNIFKPFGKFISSVIRSKNSDTLENHPIDKDKIKTEYSESVLELEERMNINTPWKKFHNV